MTRIPAALFLVLFAGIAAPALATPRDDLIARYAAESRAADPAFAGFSPARGESLHRAKHAGGKPDTPACTACHGEDTRAPGRTRTGKAIEPMAASASPSRYRAPEKIEKWFKRNCGEVLGRECTPQEKGDWLAYMMNQ